MDATLLTVNAGSSSIKLALFDADGRDTPLATALMERLGTKEAAAWMKDASGARHTLTLSPNDGTDHQSALAAVLPQMAAASPAPIEAAGHRIVHGGGAFSAPTLAGKDVLARLEEFIPLARSHQPHGLAAIRALQTLWPAIPQVCSFDTGFHTTLPEAAYTIALPAEIRARGVRRYGFHGLSYQWIAGQLPQKLGDTAEGRVIVAHLGNGASLCGMVACESRATTMGFTPLDGLVMGERPGLTDPGAILFMLEEMGLSTADIRETLFKRSGLLGLSNLSNDMRTLLATDDPKAALAVDVYCHRVAREVGAMAAEIGGAEALIFTGGVGENAALVREKIVCRLDWLGFQLDHNRNQISAEELASKESKPILIVPANEEAVIARDTRRIAHKRS
ncbi:MAG: acetate/propionate family kinase [Pseudomonadota bacterium]